MATTTTIVMAAIASGMEDTIVKRAPLCPRWHRETNHLHFHPHQNAAVAHGDFEDPMVSKAEVLVLAQSENHYL
jgi:hypothetical protein